jgi:phenylacetate-CoA ligase
MRPLAVLKNLISIKREQWLDSDSLEVLQKKKLSNMMNHASETKYYQKILEEAGIKPQEVSENLDSLPITSKEDVRKNPHSFIRLGTPKDSLLSFKTSGSTGIPVEVFGDMETYEFRTALVYDVETTFGRSPVELFAEVSCEGYKAHPLLSTTGLFPKIWLSVIEDEKKNFSIVYNSKASVLRSYPSVLTIMAKLNLEKEKPISFKSIYSGAEILNDDAREKIEDSFCAPVFNHYGAVEMRSLGFECPEEQNLHVNGSSCILEIVDEKGKPKKSGTGEIIATCLHNKVMPLLRYRIGDRGSWGGECSCGRGLPVLKSLEGRTTEVIELPSGRIHSATCLNILEIQSAFRDILKYQIIQERTDLFVVRYVCCDSDFSKKSKEEIKKGIIRACLGEEIKVEFEKVDSIPRESTGKIRSFISKIKQSKIY